MWVESLHLQNIKCFNDLTINFSENGSPFRWTTLLGENGCGKSTILQALGLLLGVPKNPYIYFYNYNNWGTKEWYNSTIGIYVQNHKNDKYEKKGIIDFQNCTKYHYHFSKQKGIVEEASIPEYLRETFETKNSGWFACGYGAFRRLELAPQSKNIYSNNLERYTNFLTLFNTNESLPTLNLWFADLDYKILKDNDIQAKHQQELVIQALNKVLENNAVYDGIDSDKQIYFRINEERIAINQLSDGYKSILSLVGDIICRLTIAFPNSNNILNEYGVILIDEIDIHLHPTWQYTIAQQLQDLFPNIQFIVATHSPIVAAGAGFEACTYKLWLENGETQCKRITNLSTKDIDDILTSTAFNLPSQFSAQTETMLQEYVILRSNKNRNAEEEKRFIELVPIVKSMNHDINEDPNSLDNRIRAFLDKNL